jgi:hypothetical protein
MIEGLTSFAGNASFGSASNGRTDVARPQHIPRSGVEAVVRSSGVGLIGRGVATQCVVWVKTETSQPIEVQGLTTKG